MTALALDLHAIKRAAIDVALARGAGAVRVTDAAFDRPTQERMARAFARGDYASWGYDEGYARDASDPQTIMPHARSVICIAMPYATPAPVGGPGRGRVSNYAWSRDYHRRLRDLLDAVARAVDAAAGEPVTTVVCDTKRLAERAFAARAGLGWIGKHTNLIAPELGSFVFLGEVATSLALPPDDSVKMSCGSCTRCVDACPTGALRGDFTLDASRCISDLTQRTDAIPRPMRALIGTWVWGCDLCQLVCPPTQRASARGGASDAPFDGEAAVPTLTELLAMTHGTFKRRLKPTAMGWRGLAVLRRNAAVALGNTLDRAVVPVLVERLSADPHPMVRGHVAWALGRIGSPAARVALQVRAATEADPDVRAEIDAALNGETA